MSSSSTRTGAKATSGARPAKKATTSSTTKATKPRSAAARPASSGPVRLFEIDPNSGPLDVSQRITVHGQNIDPTRVKLKFGGHPAVFLQATTTTAGQKITCLVPPLTKSKTGGRVQVHVVSILDEKKVLNPNDHVHYRYSPKHFIDNQAMDPLRQVFTVIDAMAQEEKELFAAAYHHQSLSQEARLNAVAVRRIMTLTQNVAHELTILGKARDRRPATSQLQSSPQVAAQKVATSGDLFADVDRKLEEAKQSKEVTDVLSDFLPEVAEDFSKVKVPVRKVAPAKRRIPVAPVVVEPVVEEEPEQPEEPKEEPVKSPRVNFRGTLEFVSPRSDSPALRSPRSSEPTFIPAAAEDEPVIRDRLDSFSEVSVDEVDLKQKQEKSMSASSYDGAELPQQLEQPEALSPALEPEQEEPKREDTPEILPAEAYLEHEEADDKEDLQEEEPQQDESDADAPREAALETEEDVLPIDSAQEELQHDPQEEAEEDVAYVSSEHVLESAVPLDEEAMKEQGVHSEPQEAAFEEDFDATPYREEPLGELLQPEETETTSPRVHFAEEETPVEQEDDAEEDSLVQSLPLTAETEEPEEETEEPSDQQAAPEKDEENRAVPTEDDEERVDELAQPEFDETDEEANLFGKTDDAGTESRDLFNDDKDTQDTPVWRDTLPVEEEQEPNPEPTVDQVPEDLEDEEKDHNEPQPDDEQEETPEDETFEHTLEDQQTDEEQEEEPETQETEAVDSVEESVSEHVLESAVPLDEEAMKEQGVHSEPQEAAFEEDFDATPYREEPLGELLQPEETETTSPRVHFAEEEMPVEQEDDAVADEEKQEDLPPQVTLDTDDLLPNDAVEEQLHPSDENNKQPEEDASPIETAEQTTLSSDEPADEQPESSVASLEPTAEDVKELSDPASSEEAISPEAPQEINQVDEPDALVEESPEESPATEEEPHEFTRPEEPADIVEDVLPAEESQQEETEPLPEDEGLAQEQEADQDTPSDHEPSEEAISQEAEQVPEEEQEEIVEPEIEAQPEEISDTELTPQKTEEEPEAEEHATTELDESPMPAAEQPEEDALSQLDEEQISPVQEQVTESELPENLSEEQEYESEPVNEDAPVEETAEAQTLSAEEIPEEEQQQEEEPAHSPDQSSVPLDEVALKHEESAEEPAEPAPEESLDQPRDDALLEEPLTDEADSTQEDTAVHFDEQVEEIPVEFEADHAQNVTESNEPFEEPLTTEASQDAEWDNKVDETGGILDAPIPIMIHPSGDNVIRSTMFALCRPDDAAFKFESLTPAVDVQAEQESLTPDYRFTRQEQKQQDFQSRILGGNDDIFGNSPPSASTKMEYTPGKSSREVKQELLRKKQEEQAAERRRLAEENAREQQLREARLAAEEEEELRREREEKEREKQKAEEAIPVVQATPTPEPLKETPKKAQVPAKVAASNDPFDDIFSSPSKKTTKPVSDPFSFSSPQKASPKPAANALFDDIFASKSPAKSSPKKDFDPFAGFTSPSKSSKPASNFDDIFG